jgi:hypothetical protein
MVRGTVFLRTDMTLTTPTIISLCIGVTSLCIGLTALYIGVKNYLRKAGVHLRGAFTTTTSRECNDKFVSEVILENLKDRAVTIFAIYLRIGHNYYIELENLEDKPLVLKAFETDQRHFGPIEFYGCNGHKLDFNKLLADHKVKKKLVLSTSDGKYEVPSVMRRWSPTYDYFRNYMTTTARPVRSTHKGKDLGSNIKYVVELIPDEGDEEIILIHPRDYELKLFRDFSLTQDALETKNTLDQYLHKMKDENKLNSKKILVYDLHEWRQRAHDFYKGEPVRAEYASAFQYHVIGRFYSMYSNWKSRRENTKRRERDKVKQ